MLHDKGGFFIADNATVLGDVRLAKDVSIWYGAVVRGDMAPITIGECSNIQDNSVLHCDPGEDLVIGSYVTVGHMAMIHAQAVGDFCLIGINCLLLNGSKVGPGCIIGAGAVVKQGQEIPPRSIVVGVPGKIIGQTPDSFLDESKERGRQAGDQKEIDEVPVQPWAKSWEEA